MVIFRQCDWSAPYVVSLRGANSRILIYLAPSRFGSWLANDLVTCVSTRSPACQSPVPDSAACSTSRCGYVTHILRWSEVALGCFLTFMSPYLCPVRKRLDANRYVDSRPFSVTGDVEVQSTDAFAPLFSPFNCCSASRHDFTKIWYRLLWRLFSNLTNLAYHFVCGLALPNVPVFAAPGIGDPIGVPVVCS